MTPEATRGWAWQWSARALCRGTILPAGPLARYHLDPFPIHFAYRRLPDSIRQVIAKLAGTLATVPSVVDTLRPLIPPDWSVDVEMRPGGGTIAVSFPDPSTLRGRRELSLFWVGRPHPEPTGPPLGYNPAARIGRGRPFQDQPNEQPHA